MQLQKWHWCATTLVSIYKWGSLPCSYRNDTDVPLLLFQYTSEDLYHAATEMPLMCHYCCFNIQVRISTMQLQKWHWCATTLVSIYKWGSSPCSYRNDTDVPLLLFQYTSEDLYHAATEMTLMCHYCCFNIQVRISTMQLQKWHWCATTLVSIYKWGSLPCSYRNDTDVTLLLFQYTSEDLYHAATEMTVMCHYCFNIQVRISTMQLQKWHWCATTLVSIYKWGSLPCSYRNDTDVPLLLFQYTSEDLYHVTENEICAINMHTFWIADYWFVSECKRTAFRDDTYFNSVTHLELYYHECCQSEKIQVERLYSCHQAISIKLNSDRNDTRTDVPLLVSLYTSEDLYHVATEMTLMCHYCCFNIQVRISTMQLQKWHWCATTLVSIYKWGSLPCSYRNDTDVPLLLFQYTSEDLYHAATEMTLMPLLLFQYTSEDLYHAATEMTLMCHYSCFNIQVRISTMQLQKWHWCATTLVSIYKWGSLPCSYRNDTDVPLLLFQYTSEDLYHVATEMTLMCHYSCFNIQVRISTMQLQKWHWCATTVVSIYKWGSLPCSYRKWQFVPSICIHSNSRLLIFIESVKEQLFETTLTSFGDAFGTVLSWVLSIWKDKVERLYSCHQAISIKLNSDRNDTRCATTLVSLYTSEDLYHVATEMTLMCHYCCFNIQVRISTMQLQKCHWCATTVVINIQVRISTMQLQKWHWCATTLVSIYKWGSLPCSYRNDTDVPLLLFQYTSEDLYHAATEMTLMCHYCCFNIQVRISTMQLQKWHWCATTLVSIYKWGSSTMQLQKCHWCATTVVSIYKWGSLPCSYRNDTDVPLLLFQYTSEDLYNEQLQKWHWCATTVVIIYKWGSLPCRYRNDTDVPLLLFQYTSEDLYHAATEMTLMCHYSCFNIQVRISTM